MISVTYPTKMSLDACPLLVFVTCIFMLFEKTFSLLEKTIELDPK